MIQLQKISSNIQFGNKDSFKSGSYTAKQNHIQINDLSDFDVSKVNYVVSQLLLKPQPVSIHEKANCEILKAIAGKLPEENTAIKLLPEQQRDLGLYFESIPASNKDVDSYVIRVKNHYLFISIFKEGGKSIIKPEFLVPKKDYGKEARIVGKDYHYAYLNEEDRAQAAKIYNTKTRKSQLKTAPTIEPDKLNFNIPVIKDRAPKVALLSFSPDNSYMFHSVGTNYLESYLDKSLGKDSVETLNIDTQLHTSGEIKEKLAQFNPDVIGISAKVNTKDVIDPWMDYIQESMPSKLVMVGGTMATYAFKELLREHPNALMVMDNGEIPTVEIMKIVKGSKPISDLGKIPNLAFNQGGKLELTPYQYFNMASHFKPSESNIKEIVEKDGTLALRWSQGCWGNCTFCTHPGKWEGTSADNIISVLKEFKEKFNIKSMFFTDDEVVPKDPKIAYARLEEFADKMIKENLDITWTVSLRADCIEWIDKQLVDKLKQSGCNSFFLGIESGSDTQLKRFGKSVKDVKVNSEVNRKALEFFKQNGIQIGIGWIPFDPVMPSLKELKENMAFFENNNLFDYNVRLNASLRAQKGSNYLNLIKNKDLGLLGDLQPNLLFYDSTYLDPRVGTIKDHVDTWVKAYSKIDSEFHTARFNVAVDPDLKNKYKNLLELGDKLQRLTFNYIMALIEEFPESEEDRLIDDEKETIKLIRDKEFITARRKNLLQEVNAKRQRLLEITQHFKAQREEIILQSKAA